jgi:predicted transcriptional regulator
MIDFRAPRVAFTVHLPAELISELQILAGEKQVSVDEVVMEACQEYTEPYFWERAFKEWRRDQPADAVKNISLDGKEISPPGDSGAKE